MSALAAMASNRIRVRAVRSLVTTIASTALIITAALALAPAAAQTPDKARHMIEGVRDARYCELIPVLRRGIQLVATVYNTLGLNDCPPELWDKITEPAMKKRFGALKVMLNGPRHLVMDAIAAAGDTAAGKTVDAEGLALTARATIKVDLSGLRAKPYRERTQEGKNVRTFFCNDGQTCVNAAGTWKCRSPAPAGMSCATCLANQKRDSDSCTRSGDLMQQSACVNRVNAEYLKCIPGCH